MGYVPSAVPSTAFSFARPYWTPGSRHTPLLLQSLFLVKGFYRTSYYLTARDGVLNKDWVHGGASFQQRSNSLLVHAVRSNPVQWIVYPGIWTNQKSTSNTILFGLRLKHLLSLICIILHTRILLFMFFLASHAVLPCTLGSTYIYPYTGIHIYIHIYQQNLRQ